MIVAIFGYKGSGKSTAASLLNKHEFTTHPLAAPLKNMLKVGFGLTNAQLYGAEKETPLEVLGGETPRRAMTTLGTEWGRKFLGKDAWVRPWEATRPTGPLIVDDMRFPNEARHLLALGARLVRIDRPGTKPEGDVHESEFYIDKLPFDHVFDNIGDVTHLAHQVQEFLFLSTPHEPNRDRRFARALEVAECCSPT